MSSWADTRSHGAALVAVLLASSSCPSAAWAQSGFDTSRPIPVYVTALPPEIPPWSESMGLTAALPASGPVRVFVEPELIHQPSGLRVLGADLLEGAAEELHDAFERATGFQVVADKEAAHVMLTLTGATKTVFWDELYDEPAVFCLQYRLRAVDVDRSGTECRDDRGGPFAVDDAPLALRLLSLGLDIIIFGGPSSPSRPFKDYRPWESLAKQLVARLGVWLRGERRTTLATEATPSDIKALKRAFDKSDQFFLVPSEVDASIVLRVLGSVKRDQRYEDWGQRYQDKTVIRTYYRVEVPGTGFDDEDVESLAYDSWSSLAEHIVDTLERWARENDARGRVAR